MIVRVKRIVDINVLENIKEEIQEQMKEGFIIHDDSIEITFAPKEVITKCSSCGSYNYELIETKDIEEIHSE